MSCILSSLIFLAVISSTTILKCNAYHILPLRVPVTPTIRVSKTQPPGATSVTSYHPLLSASPLFAETTNNDLSQDGEEEENGVFTRLIKMLKPKSSENMTPKEMLANMGLSALLSYGFVSNMSYCVSVSLAWFGFTKKTGLSPLAPGQWKGFLAVYAGFYVFNNIIRPIRIGVSVGVAKYFDEAISMVQENVKVSKGVAIGIVVFLVNIVGTCSLMSLGIFLASLASGVPIFPPKV